MKRGKPTLRRDLALRAAKKAASEAVRSSKAYSMAVEGTLVAQGSEGLALVKAVMRVYLSNRRDGP